MLISLHLPKTAGASFLCSLNEYYNQGVLRDFADIPINTPIYKRNMHALKMCIINGITPPKNTDCIHGHYLPLKYLYCRDVKFVTWMRDPIERLASHYYYWLRTYDPKNAPRLHKRVVEEQWSLERFCLGPELRNLYSQFLWGFPVKRFDFIGITEYFESDMNYFSSEFIGSALQVHKMNTNTTKDKSSYFEDNDLRKRVEQYHSKDISLYKQALKTRLTRRSSGRS